MREMLIKISITTDVPMREMRVDVRAVKKSNWTKTMQIIFNQNDRVFEVRKFNTSMTDHSKIIYLFIYDSVDVTLWIKFKVIKQL